MRKRSTLRREAHGRAMASHPILSAPSSLALCRQASSGDTISLPNGIDNQVVTVKRLGIRGNTIMIKAAPKQKPF